MDGEEKLESAEGIAQTTSIAQPRLWRSALVCTVLLCLELYALLYDIDGSRKIAGTKPVIAKYRYGVNDVRMKPAGTITWHDPALDQDLRREDTLLTMSNAQAIVEFTDGTRMGIDPDSLVVLEKTPADDNTRYQKIVLKLKHGSIAKKSAGGLPVAVDVSVPGKGQTRIEDASGDALFRLEATAEGTKLEVENGSIQVEQNGKTAEIGAFQKAVLDGEEIKIEDISVRFGELVPDLGKRVARKDGDEVVRLLWRQTSARGNGDSEEPVVLVSKHPDMNDAKTVDVERIADGQGEAHFEAERDGTYFWQVSSEDGRSRSPIATFALVTLKTPVLETYDDDESSAIVRQKVRIRWRPLDGASVYLESSDEREFNSPQRHDPKEGSNEIELQFDQPRNIYWRLRADYGEEVGVSEPTEVRLLEIKPKPRLKAPKIRKPKIRIRSDFEHRGLNILRLYSGVEKNQKAKERGEPEKPIGRWRKIAIDLAWDIVKGADQYHLQIARNKKFTKLMVDKRIRPNSYSHNMIQTEQTQMLYYRVASVDAAGDEGPFSDPYEIEIPPIPLGAKSDSELAEEEEEEPPKKTFYRIDVSVGAAFHSRNFTSDTRPTSTTAAGFVPSAVALEYRRVLGGDEEIGFEPKLTFDLGLSAIGEKGEPTTKNVKLDEFPISLLRLWIMLEKEVWGVGGGAGLYATTSQKFSWAGRRAISEKQTLLGVSASLLNSPLHYARHWHWRVQLGIVGSGALGADLNASGRYMFSVGRAVRSVDQTGLFVETELMFRYLNIETSFGGAFKLGYSL